MNALALYRRATQLLGPAIRLYLAFRRLRGKEDRQRYPERLGHASLSRPAGPLVWLHAASVGEAASLLALIDRLEQERPGVNLLITTGTVTSARLLETRLKAGRTQHQFVPVDRPAYIRGFLNHWRPDLAVWVESELWPNLIAATQARGIPTILLNGRISSQSFARWQRWPGLVKPILAGLALCLAQDEVQAGRLRQLGARGAETVGDLKTAAAPLPVDERDYATLADGIGDRPLWLAASTHAGEEEAVIAAHRILRAQFPALLTIIVPRHPARAEEVAATMQTRGVSLARRSRGEAITPATEIYLGDTLGEMGLFYRLAEIAFIGGSLTPRGGHNPMEAALLGCAILHGPDMSNCAGMAAGLREAGAARSIADAEELVREAGILLGDAAERARRVAAARAVALHDNGTLDRVLARMAPWLDPLLRPEAPSQASPAREDGRDRACA